MIESPLSPDAFAADLRTALDEPGALERYGAELRVRGISLPDALRLLPPTASTPDQAAALSAGYLRAHTQHEHAELDRVRGELDLRRAELRALQRVNAVATSSLDERTVLSKVVDAVASVMGVDVCSIYLLQGATHLLLGATRGLNPSAVGTARLSLGEGVTGWAAEKCRTVAVADLWGDARAKYLPETSEESYHSMLSVPITGSGGEKILGVLNVQTTERRDFDEHEITFMEMIAGQLGLSIENARSYGQTDAQLRQKVNALTTLHQVVVAVASSLDLRRVLDTIARQALCLCEGEGSIIYARAGTKDLRIDAQCGDCDPAHAALANQTALDVIQQGVYKCIMLPGPADQEPRTLFCVPLRGHGSTYGALAVFGRIGASFDEETVDLLTDFACEGALAIENARLHLATQQSLDAKSVLLSELHHRVKNNLQTVAALLSLAIRHSRTPEAVETLRESYNRVRSIAAAHDLLSKQAIGVTSILEVARKVIELLEPTLQQKGAIRFLTEGENIELETREATTLAILLNELLTNAVRHGLRGRESGTVRVRCGRQGSQIWVTVADDGNGLVPGFTLNKNKGLGLSIVRTLVEADLHGQIDWRSEGGAQFTLLFSPPAASAARALLSTR